MNQYEEIVRYDFEFLKLRETLVCGVCFNALMNPVQVFQCGHRFCTDCLLTSFR